MDRRIIERLKEIQPVQLQKLAEQLALVLRPKTFSRSGLVIRGRNVENQTTKGWPDAYAQATDGRIFAIEATRDKVSCKTHIKQDYEKAQDKKNHNLCGYFFVGGYPDAGLTDEEKAEWKTKFVELGFAADNVCILVGLDLVEALMAPECARIRSTLLHMAAEPAPFRWLTPGSGESDNPLVPTKEDYEQGRVYAPAILSAVVQRLLADGIALVRGRAAAGKTTLAHLIAAHPDVAPAPVYLLDIARASDDPESLRSGAIEAMAEFAGQDVLFVIDNIHLAERLTRDLTEKWKSLARSSGARLLLIGREREKVNLTPIGDLDPMLMRAGSPEMKGVINRLCHRRGRTTPQIGEVQLRAWMSTFGGNPDDAHTSVDLLAFAAAVEQRFESIAQGLMLLTEADAVAGVRERYWTPVHNPQEQDNLLRLAALSQLEIDAYDENLAFPITAFPLSAKQGFVVSSTSREESRRRYSLIHPTLGRLLLRSANVYDGGRALRLMAADGQIVLAAHLASRALDPGEARDARARWRDTGSKESWLTSCGSLLEAVTVGKQLVSQKLQTANDVDTAWACHPHFRQLRLGTRSVNAWIQFISAAKRFGFNRTLATLEAEVSEEAGVQFLGDLLVGWPPHQAVSLMRLHPNSQRLLACLDAKRWQEIRSTVSAPIFATAAVYAIRYLEEAGRLDLAQPIAERQLKAAQPQLWVQADLSDLSRLLRVAKVELSIQMSIFELLGRSGWIDQAVRTMSAGKLAGTLLSFSNFLAGETLNKLPHLALSERMNRELHTFPTDSGRSAMNTVAMLGALHEILPNYQPPPSIKWPSSEMLIDMTVVRARFDRAGTLGTHEIVLWLGIMRMAPFRPDGLTIDQAQGERVLSLLEATVAPSDRAEGTRQRLLAWLRAVKANGWLVSSSVVA